MTEATAGMIEARQAIERALTGPTSGGAARQLAPVILAAIVNGAIPGVSFTPIGEKESWPENEHPALSYLR